MVLSGDLLNILACPRCKNPVEYREQEGVLICIPCQLKYSVRDNIPVLMQDEAEKIFTLHGK